MSALEKRRCSSQRLSDGRLVEMMYDPARNPSTYLAIYADGKITYCDEVVDGECVIAPYQETAALRKGVALLPKEAIPYESEQVLAGEIVAFIEKYFTLPNDFKPVALTYVLLSWLYDRFDSIPYLRLTGSFDTGKSRGLRVLGVLCNKPIFTEGFTTPAPLFRLTNLMAGTVIFDEGDQANSRETALLVKILNSGYQKGGAVARMDRSGMDDIKFYSVYGPKIISTRGEFQDQALESRCLTLETGFLQPDKHVPLCLPEDFYEEAKRLRGKLMMYRFRNYHLLRIDSSYRIPNIQTRLSQIMLPLLTLAPSEDIKEQLVQYAVEYDKRTTMNRTTSFEHLIAQAIEKRKHRGEISLQDITLDVNKTAWDRELTPKRVGHIVRWELKLQTYRKRLGYVVLYNAERMALICKKYGLSGGDITDQTQGTTTAVNQLIEGGVHV